MQDAVHTRQEARVQRSPVVLEGLVYVSLAEQCETSAVPKDLMYPNLGSCRFDGRRVVAIVSCSHRHCKDRSNKALFLCPVQ